MTDETLLETPETPEFPMMEEIPPMDPDYTPKPAVDTSKDWMAIVSLITGILSLCGSVFAPLGCIFALAAVLLGILGLKSSKRTLAIVGLAAGGLGILLSLVFGMIAGLSLFFIEGSGY